MIRHNTTNRIVFITSYPPGICPVATFAYRLMESMIPASYGAFEPVMIAVQPDLSRTYPADVDFVIRRDFRSDYMEAADFINAGHPGAVIVQHHVDLFGTQGTSDIADMIKRVDAAVITMLHTIPENPPACFFNGLTAICDASVRLVVMNRHDRDVLSAQYGILRTKIEQIIHSRTDNPFDQQDKWFHAGRQVWNLVSGQLQWTGSDPRFFQASTERAVMCGQ